jgi:siroheme synthase-like protein
MNTSDLNKEFMPIAIDIRDKRILLIGGGRVALHKISSLQLYNADIKVLAIDVIHEIKTAGIPYVEKKYEKSDLKGAFLVYACTNIKPLNEMIYKDCKDLDILVNVVDNPPLCDFVSPAIYKKEYMSVAVTSNARSVYKSIEIRNRIRDFLENDQSMR